MPARDLFVLGINAYDHDVSACLLRNGVPVVAIAKERITREKHDFGFYEEVVSYCLAEAGIDLERVDLVITNSYLLPVPEIERRLASTHLPGLGGVHDRARAFRHPLFLSRESRVRTCSHHLAHAYSAFAASPFEEGAVMVVDGIGSYREDVTEAVPREDEAHPFAREAESYYRFRGSEIETVQKVFMGPVKGLVQDDFHEMPGLGGVYSRVSTYVFKHWDKCGEVMGLAPYGEAGMPRLMEVRDGTLVVSEWPLSLCHPYVGSSDRVWEESANRREWENLAFRVQDDIEAALIERARRLYERTGTKNLTLAGGVALNCVANAKILEETPFERVFIQAAAGDEGIALGCALYGHLAVAGGKREWVMESAGLGREYGKEEIARAAAGPLVRMGTSRRETDDAPAEAAKMLARGQIIGWFAGRSEFGPRALGHRSILADPRDPGAKDRLNSRVKHRQAFRPFAPAVPVERVGEFFDAPAESPFMNLVMRVRPEMRDVIPSVVHVDGTARVQTVRREANPRFHALLTEFGRLTGVPVLLNTSFNVKGEPIVETPADAVDCFLSTDIDALVLDDLILKKREIVRALSPFARFAVRVGRGMRSDLARERLADQLRRS